MDEFTVDAFANRGEPLPLLTVTSHDEDTSSSEVDSSKRERLKKKLSGQRLREKASEVSMRQAQKAESSPAGSLSLQDKLFSKLLKQVIPIEDLDEPSDQDQPKVDRRSSEYVRRPAFSLPTMTNNFRRFNARIGIVFVFQNRVIRLLTWRAPSHTMSFLAVYTFVCLDPYLLVVLPLAIALLFIMVPAFTARHPPPPQLRSSAARLPDSYSGPPLAPARTIKPAAETSKDFFRNMRDLQNSMADFSNLHDILVATIAPLTNFSDEILSSTVFLYLSIATTVLFTAAHLLPLRFTFLAGGYAVVISGHPSAQEWLAKQKRQAEKKATQMSDDKQRKTIFGIPVPNNAVIRQIQSLLASFSEITLSQSPARREVEIFELQHRPLLPPGNNKGLTTEWTPHLFSSSPYDPLSPARIAGSRPTGTRFFEDVMPPPGWDWDSKKWELDLEAGEWINERLIVGVEYDVVNRDEDGDDDDNDATSPGSALSRRFSANADFGGWVWDLPPAVDKANMNRDEEVWLAYGDYNLLDFEKRDKKSEKKGHSRNVSTKDWEESVSFGNRGRTGEWRRRRWVRVVRRKEVTAHEEK